LDFHVHPFSRADRRPGLLVDKEHSPHSSTPGFGLSIARSESWSVSALCGCLNFGADLIRLCCAVVDDLLQGEDSIALESPDQKTRFVIQIVLLRWFLEHVHQVFGEMPLRSYTVFESIFFADLVHYLDSTVLCFRCSSYTGFEGR
jgi:hypothetical protein